MCISVCLTTLHCFATLEINTNWRIVFLILPKTTVCKLNNFNISAVNAVQKKLHEMGEILKVCFY